MSFISSGNLSTPVESLGGGMLTDAIFFSRVGYKQSFLLFNLQALSRLQQIKSVLFFQIQHFIHNLSIKEQAFTSVCDTNKVTQLAENVGDKNNKRNPKRKAFRQKDLLNIKVSRSGAINTSTKFPKRATET